MAEKTTYPFQAEVSQVLRLVIGSLYSNREIFLRELLSNASDALDKLRFRALSEPELLPEGQPLEIRLQPSEAQQTLTIADNGIGMSAQELRDFLGTIAQSGSRAFLERLQASGGERTPSLIGQFGVGFYSAFLVAERVTVTSRAAGSDEAWVWSSDGKESYTLEPGERAEPGTSVTLHLSAEQTELLRPWKLRSLVTRYSNYLGHPIRLLPDLSKPPAEGEEPPSAEGEIINAATALWQRPAREVTQEQYAEFYQQIARDWQPPLTQDHFKVEGTLEFSGIVFIPGHPLMDLMDDQLKAGLRLYVKRVLIMEQCEELLPRWLRFVRGVVDTEDLPLNVSREILQDSRAIRVMRQQVVSHTLSALTRLAEERPEDYLKFWASFGAVFKEGLHFEPAEAPKLAKLLRFDCTGHEQPISLDEYVRQMPEGQAEIYYVTSTSRQGAEASPHIEGLRSRGWQVLLLSQPVDPFAMEQLPEYEGKRLVDASTVRLELGEQESATRAASEAVAKPLLDKLQQLLGQRVKEVKVSSRLTDSPACLVLAEGGIAPQIERILRERNQSLPRVARILEVNLTHPVLERLSRLVEAGGQDAELKDYAELLYDQALLAEGSPVDDPAQLAKRLAALMARVTS